MGGTRKTPAVRAAGRRGGGQERGGGADGDGGAGQQGGAGQGFAGAGVAAGIGDDHAVDEFGPGGQHGGVVGGVDGLGEVAPAGQRGDAVLAEEFDGGQDVRAGRQQAAVAECAEDAGVVGGGGAQFEQQPFGAADPLFQQGGERFGVAVQFLGGERPVVGAAGRVGPARGGRGVLGGLGWGAGGLGQTEEFGEPGFAGQGGGGGVFGLPGGLGRGGGVHRAGGQQVGAGVGGGGVPQPFAGQRRRLAGRLPGRGGALLGVARGQGGAGRVGAFQPAVADRFGRLRLDLGQPLPQMLGFAAGALRLGGRGGRVAVGGLRLALELRRALLLFSGRPFAVLGRRVQGAHQFAGGLAAGGERGGGVPFGFPDGGGDPCRAVGGGPVGQHRLGGLPGRVQGARVGQLPALGRCRFLGRRQGQGGVAVGEFGGDGGGVGPFASGCGDRGLGGLDRGGQLRRPLPLGAGAGGEPAGQGADPPFGRGVHGAGLFAFGGGLADPAQQIEGAGREVAFRGQFGAAAQFVGEAVHEVGEPVGVAGVGDRAQQQVGEVGVVLDGEQAGGLALVGVHLPLVAEEFRVEAEPLQLLDPAFVDLLPHHVQVGVGLAGLGEDVAEALHGAASAAGAGGALGLLLAGPQRGGFGDRQGVEVHAGAGPEGVPRLGELARVAGDLASAPLADLADHHALAGERVLPLQGHVSAVVREQEFAQHTGAGPAEGVAVAGEHHREDQLEQYGLAAAVLQEEHAGRGRAARRAGGLLLEEVGLGGGGLRHHVADSAQIEDGVGVAGAGRSDRVEADPGQLVHVAGLSWRGRGGRRTVRCGARGRAGQLWNGSPAPSTRSRSSVVSGGSSEAVPSLTGTMPSSSSSASAAPAAMSRTWSW